jgi:hypothetical protein
MASRWSDSRREKYKKFKGVDGAEKTYVRTGDRRVGDGIDGERPPGIPEGSRKKVPRSGWDERGITTRRTRECTVSNLTASSRIVGTIETDAALNRAAKKNG